MRRKIVLIPSVVACLAVSACGGSSSSTGTAGKTSASSGASNARFVAQLNSVCKRANAAYIAARKPARQVAVIQRYLLVFHAIQAPSQLQPVYARYLVVLGKELAALKRGDTSGLIKLRDTQAGPLVRQLGATGCEG